MAEFDGTQMLPCIFETERSGKEKLKATVKVLNRQISVYNTGGKYEKETAYGRMWYSGRCSLFGRMR